MPPLPLPTISHRPVPTLTQHGPFFYLDEPPHFRPIVPPPPLPSLTMYKNPRPSLILPTAAKIGIGISSAFLFVVLVAVVVSCWWKWGFGCCEMKVQRGKDGKMGKRFKKRVHTKWHKVDFEQGKERDVGKGGEIKEFWLDGRREEERREKKGKELRSFWLNGGRKNDEGTYGHRKREHWRHDRRRRGGRGGLHQSPSRRNANHIQRSQRFPVRA